MHRSAHSLLGSAVDVRVRSAWEEQLSEARQRPELRRMLSGHPDVFPRFAGYYQSLCALPRRMRRTLQGQWKRSLAAIALLLALGQAPALAATINVGGGCSLIDAIDSANDDAAHGGCAAGSGADTIVLPPGSTLTLTAINSFNPYDYGPNGLPRITTPITIEGNGSTIARDSLVPDFRIFDVAVGGELTLKQVTVANGRVPFYHGGGIRSSGTLTLIDTTVSGNVAKIGGGLQIYDATIVRSAIWGNRSYYFGGGLTTYLASNSVSIQNSTISNNLSLHYLYGNVGSWGGIHNSATMTISNSTISANSALYYGGIYNAGQLLLERSVITGNSSSLGGAADVDNKVGPGGVVTANNWSLFGETAGFTPGPNDLADTGGVLAPLADNGGPTLTHALPGGSPAIDASPADADCAATDQRGVPRPQGPACDIGAFEVDVGGTTTTTTTSTSTSTTEPSTTTTTSTSTSTTKPPTTTTTTTLPPQQSKCTSKKFTVAGKNALAETKCHAKAVKRGTAVDPECLAKADAKRSAGWDKAEAAGECLTPTGDEVVVEAQVDTFVDEVVTELVNGPGPSKCTAEKLSLAGKDALAETKCYAKAVRKGISLDQECLVKADEKLSKGWDKAEAAGDCLTPTGDEVVVEAQVDTFVEEVAGELLE